MKKLLIILFLGISVTVAQWFPEQKNEREQVARAIHQASAMQPRSTSRLENRAKDFGTPPLWKASSQADRKFFLMNGNQIIGNIYNYGGIAPGDGLTRHVNNMVWRGLGDIYQFGPLVAAQVVDTSGMIIHISSDGINDSYARDFNPLNSTVLYAWQPLPDYADAASPVMASSGAPDISPQDGKPDSWPRHWYNPSKGQYVWPGYLRQDVPNADLEVLWGMDDRENDEFAYFPFGYDTIDATINKPIRGLGVKIEGRALQWSNALAQNTIFFVYTAQNFSNRDLSDVHFGMYGDIDVGGGSPENQDDLGFFISPLDTVIRGTNIPIPLYSRNLVYLWDNPPGIGELGLKTHFSGCKFLESPGNPNDTKDNDGDGLVDESQTNLIDDDGDWRVASDDVGIDGVPETNDFGEQDGMPTHGIKLADGTVDPLRPGEPNYELTDLDESDQIGLTSFRSWRWTEKLLRDDEGTWNMLDSGFIDNSIPNFSDVIFLYGSGRIRLNKSGTDGSIKRFSIALLMGSDLNDLLTSAQTVQLIYNQNYQFYRPPDKPTIRAVPGDQRVTLYWDDVAESSVDPIAGHDFEGYVIYRSTDAQFSDINTVTDGKGTPILYEALKNGVGTEARFDVAFRNEPFTDINANGKFDTGEPYNDVNLNGKWDASIEDYWKGYSPVPYSNRGVQYYLGDNTGLVHMYVDSNKVINGQTYFYSVVAYDHGDSTKVPPTETTKRINIDPITSQLIFDVNTVRVVPGPRAIGYIPPKLKSVNGIDQISGTGTGDVKAVFIDDLDVKDQIEYSIIFNDTLTIGNQKTVAVNYSALKVTPQESKVMLFDTNNVKIGFTHILKDSVFKVTHSVSGQQYTDGVDFIIDTVLGYIRKTFSGAMATNNGPYTLRYRYLAQPPSTLLNNEEANPVFDGIKLFVKDELLSLNYLGFSSSVGLTNIVDILQPKQSPNANITLQLLPKDVEIEFTIALSDTDATGQYNNANTLDSAKIVLGSGYVKLPFKIKILNDTSKFTLLVYNESTKRYTKRFRWDPGEDIFLAYPGTTIPLPAKFTIYQNLSINRVADTLPANIIAGTKIHITTKKPFNSDDFFTFTTQGAKYNSAVAADGLDKIKVVPNPYVAVNEIEPTDRLPGTTRGSRRIYFEHLPPVCSIRIYTIAGELVKELHHSTGIENGREYWDLLNRDNLGVAYGVYIAHIEAPGVGERIVKFALIK